SLLPLLPIVSKVVYARSIVGSSMESTELKVEMVALHEKRVRKCLSKVKGKNQN
uniref:Uncharacterized protein n=1 Tax=Aegilops tauschii subsp. strangulata TaxID=200361 RepID=A0A453RJZ5_AEGTS